MCLLIVCHRASPAGALVVGANRDELMARPADPMTVLQAASPRILGGRDALAGGTWLAVNEHGVVAGLTNLPRSPDRARRSRGELPLLLTGHADAPGAAAAFAEQVRPADYNPAWLLVGDRDALYYLDLVGGERPVVRALAPGVHVLENSPLDAPSAKADHVRGLLGDVSSLDDGALVERIGAVLADHSTPDQGHVQAGRPEASLSACVHGGVYGTRTAAIVVVPDGPGPPDVRWTPARPCESSFRDAGDLWRSGVVSPAGDA